MFHEMPIDTCHWRRRIENFNNFSSFSHLNLTVISLFKLLIKLFFFCILLIAWIHLHLFFLRIFATITFCKSAIRIYDHNILYFPLLANLLFHMELHITLTEVIEHNPGPKVSLEISQYFIKIQTVFQSMIYQKSKIVRPKM